MAQQNTAKWNLGKQQGLLWAAPLMLVLFAALITAEWIMRKQQGLV